LLIFKGMIQFTCIIEKFEKNGEKTGWTYIFIPFDIAEKINKGVRKSYRVKGKMDKISISQLAMIPMGDGNFIIPLKADLRKKIKKQKGDKLAVTLELDKSELVMSADFLLCLAEEKQAEKFYMALSPSHQKYYSNWIESAKTIETKSKRIAQAIEGFKMKMGYPEMIRYYKAQKEKLI
jgi:hypothetical protein